MSKEMYADLISALKHCDAPRSYHFCQDCLFHSMNGGCSSSPKKPMEVAAYVIRRLVRDKEDLEEKRREDHKFMESIKEQNRRHRKEIQELKTTVERQKAQIILMAADQRPTATATLVARDRGIKVMECSNCHKRSLGRRNYCPCCGAKYVPYEEG